MSESSKRIQYANQRVNPASESRKRISKRIGERIQQVKTASEHSEKIQCANTESESSCGSSE